MVSLDIVRASNHRISSTLPAGLVAVFVGGTNGVGETTVRQFAKYANQPRVYIVGRSQSSGDRIVSECKALNPDGTFTFIQRDTSLMRNVDALCDELISREEVINLLFLTVGTLQTGIKTAEGLHYPMALTIYARSRIISRLLPLIRRADSIRRVVSVYCATFEGQVYMDDFQAWHLGRMADQGHEASIITLDLEAHHKEAPEISLIHNFPGAVESGIARGSIGWLMRLLKTIFAILGPLVHIPLVEAGDRHLFLCTSARFSNGSEDKTSGVPLTDELTLARGTDGKIGSGTYSIDANGESAGSKVERLLAEFRSQGMVERVRENIESGVNDALSSTNHSTEADDRQPSEA